MLNMQHTFAMLSLYALIIVLNQTGYVYNRVYYLNTSILTMMTALSIVSTIIPAAVNCENSSPESSSRSFSLVIVCENTSSAEWSNTNNLVY